MPRYSFVCPVCEHESEVERPMRDSGLPLNCDNCGRGPMNKVLGATFIFPWGGRDSFKGPTIKERQEHQLADCKARGVDAEPCGSRWV